MPPFPPSWGCSLTPQLSTHPLRCTPHAQILIGRIACILTCSNGIEKMLTQHQSRAERDPRQIVKAARKFGAGAAVMKKVLAPPRNAAAGRRPRPTGRLRLRRPVRRALRPAMRSRPHRLFGTRTSSTPRSPNNHAVAVHVARLGHLALHEQLRRHVRDGAVCLGLDRVLAQVQHPDAQGQPHKREPLTNTTLTWVAGQFFKRALDQHNPDMDTRRAQTSSVS